jgi:hypothetical protein
MTRCVNLPAISRTVSLAAYINAVRLAKANPHMVFKHGFTTWWPTTGAEIMQQFRQGMTERINAEVPYIHRRRTL